MKLSHLRLANFQGIKDLTLELDPMETRVYGDNATGKTTIANALSWLLYDKSSTGEKGFSPKTLGPEGEVHNLDHEVEATFSDGSTELTLTKTFYEKYTKIRGRSEKEFSGHTTDYAIDGVPVKKKEFDQTIADRFGDPEQLQILSNPLYFPEALDWQKRREILLEMCGDVTNEDALAQMEDPGSLPRALETHTIDQVVKMTKAKKAKINKEIEAIPNRIDEAERAIPVYMEVDSKDLEAASQEEAKAQKAIRALEEEANGPIEQEIAKLNESLRTGRLEHENNQIKANASKDSLLRALKEELHQNTTNRADKGHQREMVEAHILRLEGEREKLLEEFYIEEARTFEPTETCPTCGQAMAPEAVEEARASFNLAKSKILEAIQAKGQACNTNKIQTLADDIEKLKTEEKDLVQKRQDLQEELASIEATMDRTAYEDTQEYQDLQNKIAGLEGDKETRRAMKQEALEEAKANLDRIRTEKRALELELLHKESADAQKERIRELEEKQRTLAQEYEATEALLFLAEDFSRAKASLLDAKINKAFKTVKFKLTEEQINGGTKDVCEVIVPTKDGDLVGFGSANNAGRINAGLEIIERLADHWQTRVPVFIDNAESVTKLQGSNLQTIALYVSEADKTMRIER